MYLTLKFFYSYQLSLSSSIAQNISISMTKENLHLFFWENIKNNQFQIVLSKITKILKLY